VSEGRRSSIDALRGLVMVLMALDHARIICAPQRFAWIHSLDHVKPAWLATELVPHLCTPVFLFLAGVGTGLFEAKRGRDATVRFLLTRGLWLVLLEVTVVHVGWHTFDWRPVYALQVIWAIGLSLLLFGVLIRLPRPALWVLAAAGIAAVPLLPELPVLTGQGYLFRRGALEVGVTYPLLPWPAVLAAGYLCAPLFSGDADRRTRTLIGAGGLLLIAFVAMRAASVGDPSAWASHERGAVITTLSLFDVTKHPASPAFLAVTMGVALLLLAWFERSTGRVTAALASIGRVPLFFYVVHLPLLQVLAWLGFGAAFDAASGGWWMRGSRHWPDGYEPALWTAYAGLGVALVVMVPLCRWYGGVKAHSDSRWLKYL